MGDPSEEELREMARLAALVKRVTLFAVAAAGAYYFYAYGMGVIGSIMVAAFLVQAQLVDGSIALAIALVAGLSASTILSNMVSGPMWRFLARTGILGRWEEPGRWWLPLAGFASGFAIAFLAVPLAPEWYPPVAWYIGLGLGLTLAHSIARPNRGPHYSRVSLLPGALLLATGPPVLLATAYYGSSANILASGLVLIIYLASGTYAMRRAAALFEEAQVEGPPE